MVVIPIGTIIIHKFCIPLFPNCFIIILNFHIIWNNFCNFFKWNKVYYLKMTSI